MRYSVSESWKERVQMVLGEHELNLMELKQSDRTSFLYSHLPLNPFFLSLTSRPFLLSFVVPFTSFHISSVVRTLLLMIKAYYRA
jgi:hypothetical protein